MAITKHTVGLVTGETVEVAVSRDIGKWQATILGAAEDSYPGTSWDFDDQGFSDLEIVDAHLQWAGAPRRYIALEAR